MLTSDELISLLQQTAKPGLAGRAVAMRRRLAGESRLQAGVDEQRALLDELAAQKAVREQTRRREQVPVMPKASLASHRASLSPSDVAWIMSLPRDPAELSADDVRALVRLEAKSAPGSGDLRLVQSVLQVARRHELRLRATAALEDLRSAEPQPSSPSWIRALAATISAENPSLTPREAHERASSIVNGADGQRRHEHAQQIQTVEVALAEASQ